MFYCFKLKLLKDNKKKKKNLAHENKQDHVDTQETQNYGHSTFACISNMQYMPSQNKNKKKH